MNHNFMYFTYLGTSVSTIFCDLLSSPYYLHPIITYSTYRPRSLSVHFTQNRVDLQHVYRDAKQPFSVQSS